MQAAQEQGLATLSLVQIGKLLQNRETTSSEIAEILLDRIGASGNNAYVLTNEQALKAAAISDNRRIAGSPLSGIDGVPAALMDNICVEGMRTTCASRMLEGFVPPYSAAVAESLEQAGVILLGKLNMEEFAVGPTLGERAENTLFATTKNPVDAAYTPGSSSAGPAAAVAEDTAYFALGSDVGGSARQSAAFCGVVGLRPGFGRVSRYGLVQCASSLDQISITGKDAADCALVLSLIAGYDARDPAACKDRTPDYLRNLMGAVRLKELRIGVPKEYMGQEVGEEIRQSVKSLSAAMQEAGAVVEECSLPHTDYAVSAYQVIAAAEFSSNMNRYDGVKFGYRTASYENYDDMLRKTRTEAFGEDVKRKMLFGAYILSQEGFNAWFKPAQRVRTLVRDDFQRVFGKYDILLAPTSPVTAWPVSKQFSDPAEACAMDLCTVSASLAGLPAISIPCGNDSAGLPIGLQLIGPALSEDLLLQVARGAEELCGLV
ncbi:MAG: aspartyl/glutamyl-tRNA amidotransferase subunit A [Clostridiales bacterium]|nr:aspartyl/glutamyl-tRNA amidotransferase subunit A [Clostridiales bacterium]